MEALPEFKAVIFDLDGTLLDTLKDIAEAANRVLEKQGYDPHPLASFKKFVGDGPDVLFRRATGADSEDNPEVRKLVEAYREECHHQNDRHTHPYEGIPDLLDDWSQRGIILSILSNKMEEHAEICAARFLPLWPWRIIMGSGETIPKKPDPKGALKIASEIEIPPENILYLGDTDTDMFTAHRAGMFAIGVTWGFRDEAELKASGANLIIHHPTELIKQKS